MPKQNLYEFREELLKMTSATDRREGTDDENWYGKLLGWNEPEQEYRPIISFEKGERYLSKRVALMIWKSHQKRVGDGTADRKEMKLLD